MHEVNEVWLYEQNGLLFEVKAIARKYGIYGHDRVLIRPVAGSGEKWVDASKLREEHRQDG